MHKYKALFFTFIAVINTNFGHFWVVKGLWIGLNGNGCCEYIITSLLCVSTVCSYKIYFILSRCAVSQQGDLWTATCLLRNHIRFVVIKNHKPSTHMNIYSHPILCMSVYACARLAQTVKFINLFWLLYYYI